MNYEEFKRDIVKFSSDDECVLAISHKGEEQRYNFGADQNGMYSSIWHNPLNEGELTWKKVEELVEDGKWENYPFGKRTIMNVDGMEFIIEAYFLTDIN